MSSTPANSAMAELDVNACRSTGNVHKKQKTRQDAMDTKLGSENTKGMPEKTNDALDANDASHQGSTAFDSPTMPPLIAPNDPVIANDWMDLTDEEPVIESGHIEVISAKDHTAADISTSKTGHTTTPNKDTDSFANTSMISAANEGFWDEDRSEPKKKTQEQKDTDMIADEAQEILDLFQAPQGMVRIVIPSGKQFTLHIDVLIEKCNYFRAALTGSFLEADARLLKLTDVSDNTFGFFLKWIYSGNIKPEHNPDRCDMHNGSNLTIPGLFDLWFFADYLRAPALQNLVVTNIVDKFKNFSCHSTDDRLQHISDSIKMLWKSKGRTDRGEAAKPLRDLILDFFANPKCMPKSKAERLIKVVPASFLREFGLAAIEHSYTTEDMACDVFEGLLSPDDYYESDDEDFFLKELEGLHEKLDAGIEGVAQLRCVWEIKPKRYFVKEAKKTQETK